MSISNLKGGLGNQMFQYAIAYAMARERSTEIKLDNRMLIEYMNDKPDGYVVREFDLDIFNYTFEIADSSDVGRFLLKSQKYKTRARITKLLSFISNKYLFDNGEIVNPELSTTDLYLDGYWQTDHYFKKYESAIREMFKVRDVLDTTEYNRLLSEIKCTNSVCLNVRRGDFVGSAVHDVIGPNYYKNAIELLISSIGTDFRLYVFSDDVKWCSNNLNLHHSTFFVGHEYAGRKFGSYLHLMMQFKYYIIPNSTFAWWAAWLSDKAENKIVIAPNKWTNTEDFFQKNIVPDSWITLA